MKQNSSLNYHHQSNHHQKLSTTSTSLNGVGMKQNSGRVSALNNNNSSVSSSLGRRTHNLSAYFEVDDGDDHSEDGDPSINTTILSSNNNGQNNLGSSSSREQQIALNNDANKVNSNRPLSNQEASNHHGGSRKNQQQNDQIMKHFYMESDEDESVLETTRVYSPPQQQHQHRQQDPPNHSPSQASHSQSRSVSSKKSLTHSNKNTLEQQQPTHPFPMYPNPYQFFPYFNNFPFFPPQTHFHGGAGPQMNSSDSIHLEMQQRLYPNNSMVQSGNDDTFITDKSESSFLDKEQQIDVLLSESRQMKLIIQQQSELINTVLKKLDEVNGKLDEMKDWKRAQALLLATDTHQSSPSHQNVQKTPVDQQLKQQQSMNNSLSSVDKANSKENPSKTNNSMINNTSSSNYYHPATNTVGILKYSPTTSPVKPVINSSVESSRYNTSTTNSMLPSPSNSPIKPIKRSTPKTIDDNIPNLSSRFSVSSSNNFYSLSSPQLFDLNNKSITNTTTTPPKRNLTHLSSSISNLKDYASPKSNSPSNQQLMESQKKRLVYDMDDSLNTSRLTDSIELNGGGGGDVEDSFVYHTSCMSSFSSTPPEPFSTDMQQYLHEHILSGSKKDDLAKDSEQQKKDYTTYSSSVSSGILLRSFSKIDQV